MASNELEALVRDLADREAIRALPMRYCDCVWRRDAEGLAALFTEECTLDLSSLGQVMSSPREIREGIGKGLSSEDSRALPFIHNQVFDIDGDRATGRSYLEVHMTQGGQTRTGVGYYDDEYAREKGTWKFRSRRAHFITPPRD